MLAILDPYRNPFLTTKTGSIIPFSIRFSRELASKSVFFRSIPFDELLLSITRPIREAPSCPVAFLTSCLKGALHAFFVVMTPYRQSCVLCSPSTSRSLSSVRYAWISAAPPPATNPPDSIAALTAQTASSILSLFSFASTSVRPPG